MALVLHSPLTDKEKKNEWTVNVRWKWRCKRVGKEKDVSGICGLYEIVGNIRVIVGSSRWVE